jgi:hypothetical protein
MFFDFNEQLILAKQLQILVEQGSLLREGEHDPLPCPISSGNGRSETLLCPEEDPRPGRDVDRQRRIREVVPFFSAATEGVGEDSGRGRIYPEGAGGRANPLPGGPQATGSTFCRKIRTSATVAPSPIGWTRRGLMSSSLISG